RARHEVLEVLQPDVDLGDVLDLELPLAVEDLDAAAHADVHPVAQHVGDLLGSLPHAPLERAVHILKLQSEVGLVRLRAQPLHTDEEVAGVVQVTGPHRVGRRPGERRLCDPVARPGERRTVHASSRRQRTCPSTIVRIDAPRSVIPWKGVFRLFDRNRLRSTVHSRSGSKTVTSAMLPRRSVPPGSENARAGAQLMRSTICASVSTFFSTSCVTTSPSAVSSPTRPNGASSNACSFSS